MSRIRSIKPEFWTSEQVVNLPVVTRLFFIGLWNFCDDRGVHPYAPKVLKMRVMPGDDIGEADVLAMLAQLEQEGLINRFEGGDGKDYIWVTGWFLHQKVEKPNYKYPAPPKIGEQSANTPRTVPEQSASSPRAVGEQSAVEGIGRDRKGKGKDGEGFNAGTPAPAREATPTPPVFSENEIEPSEPVGPPATTAAASPSAVLQTWVATNPEAVAAMAASAGFDTAKHGAITDEVIKFTAHYTAKKPNERMARDPVAFFCEGFASWLIEAKRFNADRGSAPRGKPGNSGSPPKAPTAVRDRFAAMFGPNRAKALTAQQLERLASATSDTIFCEWASGMASKIQL